MGGKNPIASVMCGAWGTLARHAEQARRHYLLFALRDGRVRFPRPWTIGVEKRRCTGKRCFLAMCVCYLLSSPYVCTD